MEALITQLIGGALGGNAAGAILKKLSLGPLGNSIVGILGGGLGGQLLNNMGVLTGGGSLDIGSIVGNLLSSGVGGGVLMAIIGLIKNAIMKK
jgi:uncharacterized membrane protein YeaQ/YmgE (transglycosylase-associated protein family)